MLFHEAFRLAVPSGSTLTSDPQGKGLVLPEKARRLVPGSSWGTFTIACTIPIALFVGWYMYRIRKGKVVEASIIGGVAVLGATVAGRPGPGLAAGALLLALPRRHGLRPGGLRLRRGRLAGLAAALPARLSVQLPQDRHDLSAGDRRHRGQPEARGTHDQPVLRIRRRALLRRTDLPLCVHLHHVRGHFRVSLAGLLGNDAQDGQQGERHPDDRLRCDADGGTGGRGRPDRGGRAAQRDVLRHQHRPGQAADVHGEEPRLRAVPQGVRG